jgi:hypothetical protein
MEIRLLPLHTLFLSQQCRSSSGSHDLKDEQDSFQCRGNPGITYIGIGISIAQTKTEQKRVENQDSDFLSLSGLLSRF